MNIKRLKKALGLLVVDTLIIIGIFILQFRTDSNIIEKIGNLQITLAQAESALDGQNQSVDLQAEVSEDNNGKTLLQNVLMLSYNGINISIDDKHPAFIQKNNSDEKQQILLEAYEKGDLYFNFFFTNDVSMKVAIEDETPNAPLSIKVSLPNDVSSLDLPYSISQNMITQKMEKKSLVLDGKKNSWEFKIPGVQDKYITFNQHEEKATYSIFDDTKQFTFDNIHELAIADAFVFQQTVNSFSGNLIAAFENIVTDSSYTEQAVVSYVAAMAQKGSYPEAIERVPASFKRSTTRTYLSAPYFNTLESMNTDLEDTIRKNIEHIRINKDADSLDLFTIDHVSMNLWLYPDVETVRNILKKAAEKDMSVVTIAQVTGILEVYTDLTNYKSGYAKYLQPILDACVQKIMTSCEFEGETLTISENGVYLSVSDAVETGVALLRYGNLIENNTLQMAGRALVNSYVSDSSSFDLRTLASIYPTVAYENKYYPHFEKVFTDNGTTVWAWTCANNITFKSDTAASCVIGIEFPADWIHYVIMKGIPRFEKIFIYDIQFRTDPRFETYNSSGYVYKTAAQTLLLKSRHKTDVEDIKLVFYDNESEPETNSGVVTDGNVENSVPGENVGTITTEIVTTENTTGSAVFTENVIN